MAVDRKALEMLEAIEREEKRRKRWTEWCPHRPHPKQMEFLKLDGLEALYGGAAGGGKSDALLMAALQYVHVPGYSALILRRTYADLALPGAIMDRAHDWLQGTGATWNQQDKRWTFPSGTVLTFGYLDNERDRYRYASAEFQFIGFDELTQFPDGWYRFLFSRLRKTTQKVPLRMRSASNPGGIGHEWVYARFVENGSVERPFIPATLTDNPSADATSYREALSQLDEVTRRQLLDGIWVNDAGGLVYRAPTRIAMQPEEGRWSYLLGMDFGIRDSCAYVVVGWREGDRTTYVLESMKENNKDVTHSAEVVKAYQARFPFSQVIGDLGGMGAAFGVEFQRRHGIPIEAAQKVNKLGFIKLLNGAIERGELVIVESANRALLKEMAELPWADETHQKEAASFDNHLTDALLYSWRAAWSFLQTIAVPAVTDPVLRIQAETAAVWREHEEQMRKRSQESYEVGNKFASEEDWA